VESIPDTYGGPQMFSYAGAWKLTEKIVLDPKLERDLLRSLYSAAGAEAQGSQALQDRYMDEYLKAVRDGTSNTLLIGEASALQTLGRAIRDSIVGVPVQDITTKPKGSCCKQ
jgi:hypothetical protein